MSGEANGPVDSGGTGMAPGFRRAAADTVWLVHVGVMLFIGIGWTFPWSTVGWIYVVLAPIVLIGWWIFSGACWLSLVEAALRGEPQLFRGLESDREQTRSFVAETLTRFTGRRVSFGLATGLSYGCLAIGFLVSCLRLWLSQSPG